MSDEQQGEINEMIAERTELWAKIGDLTKQRDVLRAALDRLSDYAHHLEDCAECKFNPCDEVGDLGQSLVDADKALADLQEQLQEKASA